MRDLTEKDYKRAMLPQRYWKCYLRNIPDTVSYKKFLVEYTTKISVYYKNGIGLLLTGNYSSGKTGSSAIVLKAALANAYSGLFIASRDLCDAKINNKIFDAETEETIFDRARSVDFLVIDDLGDEAEVKSGFVPAMIEGLVRTRSDKRLPTIITTNLKIPGKDDDDKTMSLVKRYGKSTIAVLQACMYPVYVSGIDWRMQEAKQIDNLMSSVTKKE